MVDRGRMMQLRRRMFSAALASELLLWILFCTYSELKGTANTVAAEPSLIKTTAVFPYTDNIFVLAVLVHILWIPLAGESLPEAGMEMLPQL